MDVKTMTMEEVWPAIIAELQDAEDPTFEASSVHTAQVLLTNPTTKAWTFDLELYLGLLKAALAVGQVTIAAGASANVSFTITMPAAEGNYPVFLDVTVAGYPTFLEHKEGTELVTISISPAIEIGPIVW